MNQTIAPDKTARILIQTDHPPHVDFLTTQLGVLGHTLTFVPDSEAVLAILDCTKFDLLMLDAARADILEKIRNEIGCDTPIIVLAGPEEIELAELSITLGAQDYLREPFNPLFTRVRVTGCLEQHWWKKSLLERERLSRLEHDVEVARRIQNNFLPHDLPSAPGWELQACFLPARVVAGDWYDAFYLSNKRRIGFVIADVCDKGLPSALFMALCRSLIRAFASQNQQLSWMDTEQFQGEDWIAAVRQKSESLKTGSRVEERQRNAPSAGTTALKQAVKLTNAYILENHADSNMFATMFFGVLDPQTGTVSYINGGHNPPIVLDANGQIKARLKPGGPAVGILPDPHFEIGHLELQPGDVLYCFTDGVTDAMSPQGEHFGEKRLLPLLQKPGLTAMTSVKLVEEALQAHTRQGAQFDDITMIAIHRIATQQTGFFQAIS